MGNLDDYNWHKTVGPAAGQPSSIGGFMGQQDYQRDNQRQQQQGNYKGHGAGGHGEPPRWLVTNPIRRGLKLVFISFIIMNIISLFFNSKNDVVAFIGTVVVLAGMFGFLWAFGGFIAFLVKKMKRSAA